MMRKVIHIFLIVLLLITSTGVTFYSHYCQNKLESVSINSEPKSCCDGPCHCCHNESIRIKIGNDFSPSDFHFNFQPDAIITPVVQQPAYNESESEKETFLLTEGSPPLPIQTILSSLQTYLL